MGVPAAASAGRPSGGGAERDRETQAVGSGRLHDAPGAAAATRHRSHRSDEGEGRRGRGAASGPSGDGGGEVSCAQTALPPPPPAAAPTARRRVPAGEDRLTQKEPRGWRG